MHTIANDSMMRKEMIGVMMNSKNAVMMQEHQMILIGMMQNMTGNKLVNSKKMGGMAK